MAKYTIEDTTLTAIADAIRGKDGTAAAIPVSTFPDRIAAIETGGTSVVYIGSSAPTSDIGSDGDIYIVRSEAQ